ncbi:trypsin-like serine protease [Nordella sp. HKS 07]|uniref:trypsin-like peptidase domain-containing protein n=1 Tax=Nordella sp. HKS 07 TaxID=2712222 RepID=UPI0013E0FAEE|nr:trypsin-like peptidase domain-containing protein [Nordella sp. HKS 07]QIG48923.1 trypsin-like serine protease [Nordella sp. HKS 07]
MSGFRFLLILVLSAQLTGTSFAQTPDQRTPSLAPILEKVLPAIVSIAAHGRAPDEQDPLLSDPHVRKFFGLPEDASPGDHEFWTAGSGVITEAHEGLVLTSRHVVDEADDITVVLADGRRLPAAVVGADETTDLALVRVVPENLVEPIFGDSDKLRVGDYVVAVGNPFALGQTVTLGIVSALRRNPPDEDLIQTDASINPGNSGGALVNLKGEIVGINSMIFAPLGTNSGIGFAVPINTARSVVREIIKQDKASQ